MKKYFVVEADNIGYDVYLSNPFDTKVKAETYMKKCYQSHVRENKGTIDSKSLFKDLYRVLLNSNDIYYGQIREVLGNENLF